MLKFLWTEDIIGLRILFAGQQAKGFIRLI